MNLIIERGEEGGFGAGFDSDECTEWGEGPTPEAALADLLAVLCEEKYSGHNENGAFAGRDWWHSADESNVRGDGMSPERADKRAKNVHVKGGHMTKRERIAALEQRVKELEERMAAVEARWYPIWVWPPKPYEITWSDGTAAPISPSGRIWCASAWAGDPANAVTTTWDGHGPITETK